MHENCVLFLSARCGTAAFLAARHATVCLDINVCYFTKEG